MNTDTMMGHDDAFALAYMYARDVLGYSESKSHAYAIQSADELDEHLASRMHTALMAYLND